MRKILLLAIILSASTFAEKYAFMDNMTIYGGANLSGKMDIESSDGTMSFDAEKTGYTIGIEDNKEITEFSNGKLEWGFGIKYDSNFILDTGNGNKSYASTAPIYASIKASIKAAKDINLYAQGLLGYVIPYEANLTEDHELDGRLYYGLGIGAEYKNYIAGLTYDVSNYKDTYTESGAEYTDKAKCSKVALTAGYKFDVKKKPIK